MPTLPTSLIMTLLGGQLIVSHDGKEKTVDFASMLPETAFNMHYVSTRAVFPPPPFVFFGERGEAMIGAFIATPCNCTQYAL
jgi:hypothetical protein